MKISAFAELFDLKKSTIRYYTDLKLLLPEKKGNSYIYDDICTKDLKDILNLRNMGLTIEEVTKIKTFERMDISYSHEKKQVIEQMFNKKVSELILEKHQIEQQIQKLQDYSSKLPEGKDYDLLGVSIKFLDMFTCPKCSSSLSLSNGEIQNLNILNGELSCSCDYLTKIVDGILVADDGKVLDFINPLTAKRTWIDKLSLYTPDIYSLLFNQGLSLKSHSDFWNTGNIYLFNEADTEIFAMRLHDVFRPDALYIFTSISHDLLPKLKHIAEKKFPQGNFLFLRHLGELPIKRRIDRLVDINGNGSNLLYNNIGFKLFKCISDVSTDDSVCISTALSLSDNSATFKKIPDIQKRLSKVSYLDYIADSAFKVIDEKHLGSVKSKKLIFKDFDENDEIHFTMYKLKKEMSQD